MNPYLVPAQDTVEHDGIPEQDRLENQDPAVLFNTDEVTGVVTPIEQPKSTHRSIDQRPAFARAQGEDRPKSGPGSRGPYKKRQTKEVPDADTREGE